MREPYAANGEIAIPDHDPFVVANDASCSGRDAGVDERTIASWNVGLFGLRSLCRRDDPSSRTTDQHGVRRRRGYGSIGGVLSGLPRRCDVVCFQETKLTSRLDVSDVGRDNDCEWDSTHSVCSLRGKEGYSGVAVYWRCKELCPVAIEEGVCGSIGSSSIFANSAAAFSDEPDKQKALDGEGRCVWVDFETFVLCTVYVPAVFGDPALDEKVAERAEYKANFLTALEWRISSLLSCNRRVVICGDWNIAPCWRTDRAREDEAGQEPKNPSRDWLNRQLSQEGGLADIFRRAHADVTDAYTCWNVASGAQLSNFGSRIDYFLCDESQTLKSVRRVGVAQKHEGSDHAPIFLSLDRDVWKEKRPDQVAPPLACSSIFRGRQVKVSEMFSVVQNSSVETPASHAVGEPEQEKVKMATYVCKPKRKNAPEVTMKNFFAVKSKKLASQGDHTGDDNPSPVVVAPSEESRTPKMTQQEASAAWTNTFAKLALPKCRHGETCKVRTVKQKDNANFGRVFFCCPRPAGPKTNPECDCGFFQWRNNRK